MRDIQNPLRNSYRIICVVFLIFGLLLAGCTTVDESGQTVPDSNAATPGNTGTVATTESMQTFDHPDATENTRKTDDSPASIVAFRQGLVGTPQMFAVAYFGYASSDGNMTTNPYVVMAGAAPQLCADLPFLQQIPAANIVGTNGNLFCVIPADVNATVAVNRTPWNESTGTYEDAIVLYRSEAGDPFLLMTHDTPECMETEVIITDSQGNVTIWYPFVDAENRIAPLCNEEGISLYYDFSPYEARIGGTPIEMAGTWELTWTEVEGDRVASAPGSCTVEITTDGIGLFRLSYRDNHFPDDNFSDRELLVSPGELYADCGNNQWMAEVYTTQDERIHYAVTLLDDGTLLMQYRWEMDGMPMVSYGWFKKLC